MQTPVINMMLLEEQFSIHKSSPTAKLPLQVLADESIFHVSKTDEELSIVCRDTLTLNTEKTSGPYRCLKVIGPLDFNLVGIISRISSILMQRDIPIFVISTFDTDYILVSDENVDAAIKALDEDEYISITITPN